MELRHLRYFVAVAEARSLKLAAEEKLHTTQPSLSRQIRDLEDEVGTPLFIRGAKGVELTPAGRVFLDHARVMLSQAEAAVQSARQIAYPTKPSFAMGFMIGHDTTWLPAALKLLRDELPNIHVVISTQNSPQLAAALLHGGIDVAFLRREDGTVTWNSGLLSKSRSRSSCLRNIRLPPKDDHSPGDRRGNDLSASPEQPSAFQANSRRLRRAIDRYLDENGIEIRPSHEVDNLGGVMSLIASTGGVALLPRVCKDIPSGCCNNSSTGRRGAEDRSCRLAIVRRTPLLF